MTTVKSHTASCRGPITLAAVLAAYDLRVVVEDRDRAEIVVSTPEQNGPTAEMVRELSFSEQGDRISFTLKGVAISSGTVIQSGRGTMIVNGSTMVNSFVGGIYVGGDNYGNVVVGRGGSGVVQSVASVEVVAFVPKGSSIDAETMSGNVRVEGAIRQVKARTMSGNVRLDDVESPTIRTMSGNIRVRTLRGPGRFNSMSGDIEVDFTAACDVSAQSMSGDITISGQARVDARSMTGRVRTDR